MRIKRRGSLTAPGTFTLISEAIMTRDILALLITTLLMAPVAIGVYLILG